MVDRDIIIYHSKPKHRKNGRGREIKFQVKTESQLTIELQAHTVTCHTLTLTVLLHNAHDTVVTVTFRDTTLR